MVAWFQLVTCMVLGYAQHITAYNSTPMHHPFIGIKQQEDYQ